MNLKKEHTTEEKDLLTIKPAWRAFWLWITLSVIFLVPTTGLSLFTFVVIWLRIKMDKYTVTDERLMIQTGLIARHIEEIELFRIKDIVLQQNIVERLLDIGNIKIISVDATTSDLWIRRIAKPLSTKESIRKLYRTSRKNEGVISTEFINNM